MQNALGRSNLVAEPSQPSIYLDHHATTPCDARVLEAMRPYHDRAFGNPASRTHAYGWEAERAVERAREQVARAIGAEPREIVFTSGATESNNLALLGVARARGRGHVLTCRTEHRAVLDPARALRTEGFRVTELGVDPGGRLSIDAIEAALGPDTCLVSLMHANNEIGVIHPLGEIARLTGARGIPFHTDAAQSAGKIPLDVRALGVDLLSLSGHKLYGPKGVGALYVRRARPPLRIQPLLHGGGHEGGLRSGTLPVPLLVGLGEACALAEREREAEARRISALRDRLLQGLRERIPDLRRNGDPAACLPHNLNLCFPGVESEALLLALPDVALSTGSACTSGSPEPSHVLAALGLSAELAHASVRFGLGRGTTAAEVELVIARVAEEVARLRALSPPRRRARR
jgi:cysteine desulfurase